MASISNEVLPLSEWCMALSKAPRFRKLIFCVVFLACALVLFWIKYLAPFLSEERSAWSAINTRFDTAASVHGESHSGDLVAIADLDPKLIPRSTFSKHTDPADRRRLIFIGDIHGCKTELLALLDEAKFNPRTDHLVCTGDMIDKGPDTAGVIDLLRDYNASCVRGNHEDDLLRVVDEIQSGNVYKYAELTAEKGSRSSKVSRRKKDSKMALASSLTPEQLSFLRKCPLILRIGGLKSLGGQVLVVHAGLVPGLALNRQDPTSVMNMRLIDLRKHIPSKLHEKTGSIPWYILWNKYQRLLPLHQQVFGFKSLDQISSAGIHTTVIYGHDAKRGLQIRKYTKGLDSGCVKGRKLTALILADGGKESIVQVNCMNQNRGGNP